MLNVEKRTLKKIKPLHLKVAFAFLLCGHGLQIRASVVELYPCYRVLFFKTIPHEG